MLTLARGQFRKAHVFARIVLGDRFGNLEAEALVPSIVAEVVTNRRPAKARSGTKGSVGVLETVARIEVGHALKRLLHALSAKVGVLFLPGDLVEQAKPRDV